MKCVDHGRIGALHPTLEPTGVLFSSAQVPEGFEMRVEVGTCRNSALATWRVKLDTDGWSTVRLPLPKV
ncbi:hypothetical protein BMS3Bbin02_01020 [bacterium BMS3Bbin02]|nr:hypothetical protein BMS3Bbin02_01020 [bacterium BMS3Bbin02]